MYGDGVTMAVHRGTLWFGLLGGAVAWTVHLLAAYGVAEFGCLAGLDAYTYRGVTLVVWSVLGLTAVTLPVALAATGVAARCTYRLRTDAEQEEERAELLTARTGMLASGMFAFAIVFQSVPIVYYLQSC